MVRTPSWAPPGWPAEVERWVDLRLAAAGLRRTGGIDEVKVRAWSAVMTVPVEGGRLYFKALPPGLEHEAALTARLAEWFPDVVVPVLAADEARGWMLMPDAGTRLRESLKREDAEKVWTRILNGYAETQVRSVPKVDLLLAAGVPDRRLARMPALVDRMLAFVASTVDQAPGALSEAEVERLHALRPALLRAAERLAAFGIPETVQHDDLHDRNILVSDGRCLIFDWGDASISHPFLSLRAPFVNLGERFHVPKGDAVLARLRDAYLSHWQSFASLPALVEAYELSRPLAIVTPLLTWEAALKNATDSERSDPDGFTAGLIRELLALMERPDGN